MASIRKRDLFKVLMRSFYIQSTWNPERLLGLGFGFCLIPIARRLFDDKKELINFLQRHLDFFNSHPYMATYALGAIASIEQQAVAKGWEDKRSISVFKTRIIGPLGAIGDTLFWQLIRPASGLLGIVLLSLFGFWGSIIYLVAYNLVHFYVRIKGLIKSYIKGFDIVRDLSLRGTKKYFQGMKILFSSFFGIAVAFFMTRIYQTPFSWAGVIVFLVSILVSSYIMRRPKITVDMLIIIVICSSIIIGLMV